MRTHFLIEDAGRAQLAGILEIYNEVIRNSTAVYSETPVTLEERAAWFDAKAAAGLPVLIARKEDEVLGFATFGQFRAWPGYRFSVEHTLHVRADSRGRGIGRALLEALLARAASMQMHAMIAGIDADNGASIALHERLGFRVVGHFREVGFKFGRWLDLKFLQRLI